MYPQTLKRRPGAAQYVHIWADQGIEKIVAHSTEWHIYFPRIIKQTRSPAQPPFGVAYLPHEHTTLDQSI